MADQDRKGSTGLVIEERMTETYRSLRESIKNFDSDSPLRTLLVVDVDRPSPSSVAFNLARAFEQAQNQTVLVDTNFRQTGDQARGLAEIIATGKLDVKKSGESGEPASIGPGKSGDPDLLSSQAFRDALDTIRQRFDYTILTCDAFPAYGDALAIAPAVDGVALVISAGVTRRERAIAARDALERVGANLIGMVMIERPRRWF